MLKAIVGVIVGYIVMAAFVFLTFTALYLLVLGADRAFREGSWDVSTTWLLCSFALGLIAAILGGLTCAAIARPGSRAPMVLATVTLILGLLAAALALVPEDTEPPPRTSEVGNLEAMQYAKSPPVALFANPFIGAIGVLIGARLRGGGGVPG